MTDGFNSDPGNREGFPLYHAPDIRLQELRFLQLDDLTDEVDCLRPWFKRWADNDLLVASVEDLASTFGCELIWEFTTELFSRARPIGVLLAEHPTRFESVTQWLVLDNRAMPHSSVTEAELVRSRVGEFFFLPEPLEGHTTEEVRSAAAATGFEIGEVERFFLVFGGLRDSAPYYGGDGFEMSPSDYGTLDAGQPFEADWDGCQVICTRGNVDYYLLRDRKEVAYKPIEPDRPIELYANRFSEFVIKWIREPRPLNYYSSADWQFSRWKWEDDGGCIGFA